MDTQPGAGRTSEPDLDPPVTRAEFARMRWHLDELRTAIFGGAGVIGMREHAHVTETELRANDRLLAERLNALAWPKMLALSFTFVGIIFGLCGIEFFLIKLKELHALGFW